MSGNPGKLVTGKDKSDLLPQDFIDRIEQNVLKRRQTTTVFLAPLLLIGLYLTSRINYLLFHTLAELFSIVVACCLSMIAWNARAYIKNQYLMFIGIGYLFIALLDLLHTLAYKGMPIFTDYDYYANQLWIAARYLESFTLLIAFNYLLSNKQLQLVRISISYSLVTFILIASIFWWKIFPECFIAEQGLTPFKKISEYIICAILAVTALLFHLSREYFDRKIFLLLLGSLGCTIVSELSFTFYISNYGFSNLVGHYFKIFSYYLIYQAIIETGIREPFALLFRELEASNNQLQREVNTRKTTELELKEALEQVKTLTGIIPICSYCKKLRDDEGYWQQLEQFLRDHSTAEFSHGICPECYEKVMQQLKSKKG